MEVRGFGRCSGLGPVIGFTCARPAPSAHRPAPARIPRPPVFHPVRANCIRANCVSRPIRVHSSSVPAAAIKTLLISLAYVFLLITALVIVNIVLTRRTREERDAERLRRRQRKP